MANYIESFELSKLSPTIKFISPTSSVRYQLHGKTRIQFRNTLFLP